MGRLPSHAGLVGDWIRAVGCCAHTDHRPTRGVVQALIELGLIAVMGGAMAWDRRRRGTYPTGRPPRELRPAIGILVLGAIVVGGVAWFVGAQLSVGLAAIVAAVGAWAVVSWYEHSYAAIAARVRERLK